jgi:hypothetical protein
MRHQARPVLLRAFLLVVALSLTAIGFAQQAPSLPAPVVQQSEAAAQNSSALTNKDVIEMLKGGTIYRGRHRKDQEFCDCI